MNAQDVQRPRVAAVTWFVAMVTLWIAFLVVATWSGGTLTDT